ncbi:MAG: tRNA pseudouridine(13) synthase TruD [Promethearchaeota archaeon]
MLDQEKDTYTFKENTEKEVEKFVGIDAFATAGLDGIGGVYKNHFKDFIVKEIVENGRVLNIKENSTNSAFSEDLNDRFTTFNLVKVNMDTFEAVKKIIRALKIPYELIKYSGLKDKQSISVQRISIKGNYIKQLKNMKLRDIFIRNITPTRKSVKLGSHLGNNFTVVVRNVERSKNLRSNVNRIINFLTEFGFPNYFGLQRFGSIRPNSHIVGHFLLNNDYENAFNEYVLNTYSTEPNESRKARNNLKKERNFEEALKTFPLGLNYERKMIEYLISNPGDYHGAINTLPYDLKRLLISSFQSFLFNKLLSLRIKKGLSLFKPNSGDVISILDEFNGNISPVKYTYGGSYDRYLDDALKLNRASIVIPIIGKLTNLDDFPLMSSIFKEVAKKEKISEYIFKSEIIDKDEFKGSIRAMTVKPRDLIMTDLSEDDLNREKMKIKVEFSLQRGSYATMLIREIIK